MLSFEDESRKRAVPSLPARPTAASLTISGSATRTSGSIRIGAIAWMHKRKVPFQRRRVRPRTTAATVTAAATAIMTSPTTVTIWLCTRAWTQTPGGSSAAAAAGCAGGRRQARQRRVLFPLGSTGSVFRQAWSPPSPGARARCGLPTSTGSWSARARRGTCSTRSGAGLRRAALSGGDREREPGDRGGGGHRKPGPLPIIDGEGAHGAVGDRQRVLSAAEERPGVTEIVETRARPLVDDRLRAARGGRHGARVRQAVCLGHARQRIVSLSLCLVAASGSFPGSGRGTARWWVRRRWGARRATSLRRAHQRVRVVRGLSGAGRPGGWS